MALRSRSSPSAAAPVGVVEVRAARRDGVDGFPAPRPCRGNRWRSAARPGPPRGTGPGTMEVLHADGPLLPRARGDRSRTPARRNAQRVGAHGPARPGPSLPGAARAHLRAAPARVLRAGVQLRRDVPRHPGARASNDGGQLYEDAIDRKPPLVPYIYAATFAFFDTTALWSVRVVAMLAVALTALLLAIEARRRYGTARDGSPGSCSCARWSRSRRRTARPRTSRCSCCRR